MTYLSELIEELKDDTAWQRTPEMLANSDYRKMIVNAIKTLFIDTGRASEYSKERLTKDEDDKEIFNYDFGIDEEKYILLVAKINFFKRVQSDVNNIVSYSTDALTVTAADKPYAHLQDTIGQLENERRIVFYKMSRFACLQS